MDMDVSQYRELFVSEAQEQLEALNKALLEFEREPGDTEKLSEIFRPAHTIKGMAATMGFERMAELAHEAENVLDGLRTSALEPTPEVIDALFRSMDALAEMVKSVEATGEQGADPAGLLAQLRDLGTEGVQEKHVFRSYREEEPEPEEEEPPAAAFERTEMVAAPAAKPGTRTYEIEVRLASRSMLKSVRVFMVMKKLQETAEIIGSDPSAEDLEDEKFGDVFAITAISQKPPEELRRGLLSISEIEGVEVREAGAASPPFQAEPVPGEQPQSPPETERYQAAFPAKAQSVRVNIGRLDRLMNLVGELVINRTRLQELADGGDPRDTKEALGHMARLVGELQDEVMKTRMVPVEQIFNRFPRMVRDLARSKAKEVELVIEGREIELDRTILDEIGEPLMHLLRNAVDHGVERPEARLLASKTARAQIVLRARRDRDQVSIEVSDDGPGVDAEHILTLGVARGLLAPEEAHPDALLYLLTRPGFSSREEVSGTSGRGVGLDVVRTKVESLGGSLALWTEQGVGTTFAMKLPLTLAIIQALLISTGGETYAMPLAAVRETVTIDPYNIRSVRGREVIVLREETIPLIHLEALLGLAGEAGSDAFPAVICDVGQRTIALGCQALLGRQEIVIRPLDQFLRGIRGFSGATILGDGSVALILDVAGLQASRGREPV
ncbi:MAG: chemotaxis protein CheA [Candidatus Geothermincolia bacterium]